MIIVGKNVAIENSDDGKWVKRALTKFDHVVFQQTDSKWSWKKEIRFHYRLRECLQALERDSQEKQEIVRKDRERFTVITPNWGHKWVSFIRGPAWGSLGLVIAFGIYYLVDSSPHDLLRRIGELISIWLILIVLLSVLKGLLYLLRIIS